MFSPSCSMLWFPETRKGAAAADDTFRLMWRRKNLLAKEDKLTTDDHTQKDGRNRTRETYYEKRQENWWLFPLWEGRVSPCSLSVQNLACWWSIFHFEGQRMSKPEDQPIICGTLYFAPLLFISWFMTGKTTPLNVMILSLSHVSGNVSVMSLCVFGDVRQKLKSQVSTQKGKKTAGEETNLYDFGHLKAKEETSDTDVQSQRRDDSSRRWEWRSTSSITPPFACPFSSLLQDNHPFSCSSFKSILKGHPFSLTSQSDTEQRRQ